MPKSQLELNIILQDFPIPNPPYSEDTSKMGFALYLVYHAKLGTNKSSDELFSDFLKEYQGNYSRLQDFVFEYLGRRSPEGAMPVYPLIEEIKQGPYNTMNPWNWFGQFASEWFHKTEVNESFVSRSSSVFLSLSPAAKDYMEFHVFIPQAIKKPIVWPVG